MAWLFGEVSAIRPWRPPRVCRGDVARLGGSVVVLCGRETICFLCCGVSCAFCDETPSLV